MLRTDANGLLIPAVIGTDGDGTAYDTEELLFRVHVEMMAEIGKVFVEDDYRQICGQDVVTCCQIMCDRFGLGTDPIALRAERKRRLDLLLPLVQEMPGAVELYELIMSLAVPHPLVSSAAQQHIDIVLGVLGTRHRYTHIVSADTLGHRRLKPDAYPYEYTADLYGVPNGVCLTFEDTPHGAQSAWSAGWIVVAKPNRFVDISAFVACAHVIISPDRDLSHFHLRDVQPYLEPYR